MTRATPARGAAAQGLPRDVRGKRALILASARALFIQSYERTTMDAIAERATVSKATLYAHFAGKEDLFVALVEDEVEALRQASTATGGRADFSVEDRLMRFGTQLLELTLKSDNLALLRVLIGAGQRFPALTQRVVDSVRAPIRSAVVQLLEQAVAAGELVCDDRRFAADFFMRIINGGIRIDCLLDERLRPTPAQIHEHVGLCVQAFGLLLQARNGGPAGTTGPPR
ncbi:TetR/AcrR family transcriptional regulator [Robbsia sp. Bb-Pol-6]|uniref:TetR/AcrR family transcriptional regulator n=1 Tax=Robbsia betulipollinis TaxID=2981849 RepID=A0ABT3ZNH8_9BURK|nr:TetR/AcrR family transcriptional regulator [Robbsia betulipollinis]MCY0388103.1 TetR/AcrR family transcriptional regulator [Robbsia betulipollinis]